MTLLEQFQRIYGQLTAEEKRQDILSVSIDELNLILPITYASYQHLQQRYSQRIVITQPPSEPTSEKNNQLLSIFGRISQISPIVPSVTQVELKCRTCKTTHVLHRDVPITTIDEGEIKRYRCYKRSCQTGVPSFDREYVYLDTCQSNLVYADGQEIPIYITTEQTGMRHVRAKILHAMQVKIPVICDGVLQIAKHHQKFAYFLKVFDIRFVAPFNSSNVSSETYFEQFHVGSIPNNEKEMIMSLFFMNYRFMRQYLDFQTYSLQREYPDLTVYGGSSGVRNIEFEYDVANFYRHGHHEQQEHAVCDLIIAWQCTTERQDFPYILLSDLDGVLIPMTETMMNVDVLKANITQMQQIIRILFRHRPSYIDTLLILPWLDYRPHVSQFTFDVYLNLQNASEKDIHGLEELRFLFGSPASHWHILTERFHLTEAQDEIVITIAFEDEQEESAITSEEIEMLQDLTSQVQTYQMIQTTFQTLAPVNYSHKIHTLFSVVQSMEKTMKHLFLATIWSTAHGRSKILNQDINQIFKLQNNSTIMFGSESENHG